MRDVVVVLEVGIVLGDKHLVVDVAVVVERLGASGAEVVRVVVKFSADATLPVSGLFLIAYFVLGALMAVLPESFVLFLGHDDVLCLNLNIKTFIISDDLAVDFK